MADTQQESQQVEAAIREWWSALVARDVERLKSLWDQDYPQLIYIAEENNGPLRDWAAISSYYDNIADVLESMEGTIDNLVVDVIGDAAYAYCSFLAKPRIKGFDRDMSFDGRNTFVLRKTGGRWRMVHYHESLSRDHSHDTWGFLWS